MTQPAKAPPPTLRPSHVLGTCVLYAVVSALSAALGTIVTFRALLRLIRPDQALTWGALVRFLFN